MSDTRRLTRNSDVVFWLHLAAAPLLVHPLFMLLGWFGTTSAPHDPHPALALLAYAALAFAAIVIDRRPLLVSGLAYMLGATGSLLSSSSGPGHNFTLACSPQSLALRVGWARGCSW